MLQVWVFQSGFESELPQWRVLTLRECRSCELWPYKNNICSCATILLIWLFVPGFVGAAVCCTICCMTASAFNHMPYMQNKLVLLRQAKKRHCFITRVPSVTTNICNSGSGAKPMLQLNVACCNFGRLHVFSIRALTTQRGRQRGG